MKYNCSKCKDTGMERIWGNLTGQPEWFQRRCSCLFSLARHTSINLMERYKTLSMRVSRCCGLKPAYEAEDELPCHRAAEISSRIWRIDPVCMEALLLVDDMAIFVNEYISEK